MPNVFFIAAFALLFITLFGVMRDRNRLRDRATEAEFTVNLQQIEINHLREEIERQRKLAPWAEKKNG